MVKGLLQLSHILRSLTEAAAHFRFISQEPGNRGAVTELFFYSLHKGIEGIIMGYLIAREIFHSFSP